MHDDIDHQRLQAKIAFLERASAELSDVVYAQQRETRACRPGSRRRRSRLEAVSESYRPLSLEEEKPPHY